MKYAEMTAAALKDVDRERTLVVLPIAAVEQHGPHMPTGTDWILCTGVADALESALPRQLLQLPTLWMGASSHHLRFGATVDAALPTYIATLVDAGRSLLNDGFQRLLILNGHGGNVDPLRVALRQLQPDFPQALLVGGSYWSVADRVIQDTLQGAHKFVGHACEFETSMMLHLRPELVNQELLSDAGELVTDVIDGLFVSRDMWQRTAAGFTGRPDLATADKGKLLLDGIVKSLVGHVETLLTQPLGGSYRDFA